MPLDVGLGLLVGLLVEQVFHLQHGWLIPAAGALLALAPDLDFVLHLIRHGSSRDASHHREALHLPLIYVPAGILLFLPFGIMWSCLFLFASLVHFVHDSIGIGWGVPWLYPFTDDAYSFLYHLENTIDKPTLPHRWRYVWRRRDIDKLARRYGDPDWLVNIYLKPHPYALVEYATLVTGLVAVMIDLQR